MNYIKLVIFVCLASFLVISCADTATSKEKSSKTTASTKEQPPEKTVEEMTFIETTQALLTKLKNKDEDYQKLTQKLATANPEQLNQELQTDNEKLAFWVNVYNAYIITTLSQAPDLYQDRGEFFKKDQVNIAGETLSFDKIEHGIIRSSTMKLSKGYLGKIFPGDFEKEFRMEDIDPRIHFVLNCGAKDCPPVYIYNPITLDSDFDGVASAYLKRVSEYDANKQIVQTTPLFQWFTGDWGGKDGVRDMLAEYEIIPEQHEDIELEFIDYDWTLDIDNFGDKTVSVK